MLLRSATLLHLDPPGLEGACMRVEAGMIVDVAREIEPRPGEAIEDLRGGLVMPGLVVGHHHLYSALARGMPAPPRPPRDFEEILSHVWWRLDQALDEESNTVSALVGAADAALCGVTTIVDHHASPNAIDGSLDHIRRGIDDVGLRGVLCYEITDRHGPEGREKGLAENERFLRATSAAGTNGNADGNAGADGSAGLIAGGRRFAGLVGAHAAFTLSDDALAACGRMAEAHRSGVHIHVSEDPCDDARCRERFGRSALDRLDAAGILRPGALLCHCTHLDDAAVSRALDAGCAFAHCPRSNMNNGVGYAPVASMHGSTILGTDGISGDLFEELRAAWFKSCDARTGLGAGNMVAMLARSARFASERLGVKLGRLEPGAAADLVFLDYDPPTPLTNDNVVGHLLFGLSSRHVRTVWVGGRRVVDDRRVIRVMPERLGADSRRVAAELWKRMGAIAV